MPPLAELDPPKLALPPFAPPLAMGVPSSEAEQPTIAPETNNAPPTPSTTTRGNSEPNDERFPLRGSTE